MSHENTPLMDSSKLYDRYLVTIAIRERIDGGVPKDPKLIEDWVKAKTKHDDEVTQKQAKEHKKDLETKVEEVAKGMWTGFKKDDNGWYVETRQVKAMFRESSTLLGITKKKRGSRQVLQHGFEVKGKDLGSKVYLENVEKMKNEEKAIHVMTPQGPRSALKRCDFATEGTMLRFEVWVLTTAPQETRHLGKDDLELMLTHAQENGLGANRSQGSGKFDVIEFQRV